MTMQKHVLAALLLLTCTNADPACTELLMRRECKQAPNCVWKREGDRKFCAQQAVTPVTIQPQPTPAPIQPQPTPAPIQPQPTPAPVEPLTQAAPFKREMLPAVVGSPWNVKPLRCNDECAMSCPTDRPFLLDGVCVEEAEPHDGAQYCSEQTGLWNMLDEMEFEALVDAYNAGALVVSEAAMVQRLIYTRLAALRAMPWSTLPEDQVMPGLKGEIEGFPRRRVQYHHKWKMCFGGNGGGWNQECMDENGNEIPEFQKNEFCRSRKPEKIVIRSDRFINYMWVRKNTRRGFTWGGDKNVQKETIVYKPPNNCITAVGIRSGAVLDAINFVSQTTSLNWSSGWIGGGGGQHHLMLGPGNSCLTRIWLKTGTIVDRICLRFSN